MPTPLSCLRRLAERWTSAVSGPRTKSMEREKGFEPSTLCLGSTLVSLILRISRLPLDAPANLRLAVKWQWDGSNFGDRQCR